MRIISKEFAYLLENIMAEPIRLITLVKIIVFFLKSHKVHVTDPNKIHLSLANIKNFNII